MRVTPAPPKAKPPKPPRFHVVNVELVGTGDLIAFVDVRIGDGPAAFKVCKFRWLRAKQDGTPWLSAPQEIWTDADTGRRHYRNLFVPPAAWREPLTQAVAAAVATAAGTEQGQEGSR